MFARSKRRQLNKARPKGEPSSVGETKQVGGKLFKKAFRPLAYPHTPLLKAQLVHKIAARERVGIVALQNKSLSAIYFRITVTKRQKRAL